MSEIYSDAEEINDGRPSASDEIRQSISTEGSRLQAGVFGRAPETQKQEATEEPEPVAPEYVLDTIEQNLALRQRLEAAEAEVEFAADNALDEIAYETDDYTTREEYSNAADYLLQNGGRERLAYLLTDWASYDPEGAEAWAQDRESAVTQALVQGRTEEAEQLQKAHEAKYRRVLEDFQARHPETKAGSFQNELLATALRYDPNAFASPATFLRSLENGYEQLGEAVKAYNRAAAVADLRAEFKQESIRHSGFRAPTARGTAPVSAYRQSPDENALAAAAIARMNGTKAQREARSEANQQEFKSDFSELATRHNRGVFERPKRERVVAPRKKPGVF